MDLTVDDRVRNPPPLGGHSTSSSGFRQRWSGDGCRLELPFLRRLFRAAVFSPDAVRIHLLAFAGQAPDFGMFAPYLRGFDVAVLPRRFTTEKLVELTAQLSLVSNVPTCSDTDAAILPSTDDLR